jgi:hypothetical protein
MCRLSGLGIDPVVALHLRNAADYRLPTVGSHGTKLGHSWYNWIIISVFSGWFDNSKTGEVSGQIEWMGGVDPVVALHLKNAADYRLRTFGSHRTKLGHAWFQWIIKSDLSGWFDNSEKGDMFWHCRCMWCWSCGCTRPQQCCRVPPTYFWVTWDQSRAFLISVNNKKCVFWLFWQFWKRRGVWAL